MRVYHQNRQSIYKYDPWKIIEEGFQPEFNHRSETIFALGNGYIGLRGTFEEGFPGDPKETTPGTYINGIYESEPIPYGEFIYGMPDLSQTLLNLADWKIVRLRIEGEWFHLLHGKIEDYTRTLDLQAGHLTRELIWTSPRGHQVALKIQRCISLSEIHRAVIRFELTPLNFSGEVQISSEIDGHVRNHHYLKKQALEVLETKITGEESYLLQKTRHTQMGIIFAMNHQLTSTDADFTYIESKKADEFQLKFTYQWQAQVGESYYFDKFIGFYTTRDFTIEELPAVALNEVKAAKEAGLTGILEVQSRFLHDFWEDADISIEGDIALQQGVRFNAFQLLQSCGRDGKTSIGAKGLTGEYYEGHYFWDTEIYINPFFLYRRPQFVRNLLMYRYRTLDAARNRAKILRNKGALYAWRTINGDEASAFFLGSTAQYHINAAITYAIHQYVEATGDEDFLVHYGAEIIFETSRLWADRGGFIPMKENKFCINEVCGPDEYKAGVNNNCYTNYMARFNLQYGVEVANLLQIKYPDFYQQLTDKINLSDVEIAEWERCAEQMYLPYSDELGIHPQDDSFLYKEDLDVDKLPEDQIPLVRHWHPLNIWRYQLCKQADVALLLFLQGDLFDLEQKKADYDYYEPRTTHDSSLSSAIFSIIATEIGYHEQAYNYFMQTARLDLDDYNNNAYEGVHTACMAGSSLCVSHGFGGMRVFEGELHFQPYLPKNWQAYQFKVRFLGQQLTIRVEKDKVIYTLVGDQLSFYHGQELVELSGGEKCEFLINTP